MTSNMLVGISFVKLFDAGSNIVPRPKTIAPNKIIYELTI